ncbi:oxidoreductase [Leucothrix arctica]|uniref:Oxidoreductase n=1 Tax=Leucothrix arctica TaxID=1481894 RepID=A0A317CHV0_9GAMM|nr:oxidoreductase [Leucothrix arctica]PWQ98125.1 oxidoreductase [Leucothrix arctica]
MTELNNEARIKTALIGYGFSSQTFHVPFLLCNDNFEITAISSSKPELVKEKLPAVTVYASAEALITEADVDLVIITTPNEYHFPLAKLALENGKHIVIEKPFVTNSQDGQTLIDLAKKYDRVASVFQNRRWDGDFLTVKKLIDEERLGDVRVFESHFSRFRPTPKQRWRESDAVGAGILFDLGPHLIDQTLQLFGMPQAVTAQCRQMREGCESVDFFHLVLHYEQHLAILEATPYSSAPNARFSVQGTKAQYVVQGLDPQEDRLKAGISPKFDSWSQEDEENFGHLYIDDQVKTVATERGKYQCYFSRIAKAITDNAEIPVTLDDALNNIKIIELAMESSDSGKTVTVS